MDMPQQRQALPLLFRFVVVSFSGSIVCRGNFLVVLIVDIRVTFVAVVVQRERAALEIIEQALEPSWRKAIQALHERDKPTQVSMAAGEAVQALGRAQEAGDQAVCPSWEQCKKASPGEGGRGGGWGSGGGACGGRGGFGFRGGRWRLGRGFLHVWAT